MKLYLPFFFTVLSCITSCINQQKQIKKVPSDLFGIWIPKNVNWNTYDPGISEDLKIHKEVSIVLLNFMPDNEAKIIYTTISLGEKDSLNTQVDIHCDHFKWLIDKNNKVIISDLKSKSNVVSINTLKDSIFNVSINNNKYIKTKMFDNWSLREIKNCPLESYP